MRQQVVLREEELLINNCSNSICVLCPFIFARVPINSLLHITVDVKLVVNNANLFKIVVILRQQGLNSPHEGSSIPTPAPCTSLEATFSSLSMNKKGLLCSECFNVDPRV